MELDPEIAALLALQASLGLPPLRSLPLAVARSNYDLGASLLDPTPPTDLSVEEFEIPTEGGALRAKRFTPPAPSAGVLLWLHGGGWVQGSLASHDPLLRRLAALTARPVVGVEYRLAPEHPFPEGLYDVLAAFGWLAGSGSGPVAIGGDSAGATLALVASNLLRSTATRPVVQVLAYPALGPHLVTDSVVEFAEGFGLSADEMAYLYSLYLPDEQDPSDTRVSPLLEVSLLDAPPAIITVAGFDVLRDEGLAYAGLLRGASVRVDLLDEPTLIHGYLRMAGVSTASLAAVERLGRAIAARFDQIDQGTR